jgi:3-oxoacyl-[acyl-carrier protein] reductase
MDLGLRGRVAVVVASSRGLGKAAARELAREGARVVISARGQEELVATAEEIRQQTGSAVLPVIADVTRPPEIEALVRAAEQEFGHIDILVNNAGGPPPGQFTDMTDEDWLAAINLNLMSTIRLTRLALPGMLSRRWGRIINITSFSVKQPIATLILSNTARTGVVAMAKTLSRQVAAQGVTVNNVCPGYFLTDRMRNIARADARSEGKDPDEIISRWESAIPVGRLGRPEELAALITFLASERASFITGCTIQVDGGMLTGLL